MHACDTIVFDYSLVHEDEIPLEFRLQDSFPSLQNLGRTAGQGCSFCALLIDSISKVFTNHHATLPVDFEITGRLQTEGTLRSGLEEEENGVYLLSLDLTYSEGKMTSLYFSVHAAEGTVAASIGRISRRPLHQDVTGIAAIELMNKWIRECQDDHDSCKLGKHADLPTRVLDLSTEDLGADCRLVQSSSVANKSASYIALSHCWGLPSVGTPVASTTSVTLSERMQVISLESLPRNFRDAIVITRLLGIRYLWIDSLCIIQDSKEDWEKEGGRMSQTYEGAYLTVAATSASSANEGFLSRSPLAYATIPFRAPTSNHQAGQLLLKSAKSVTMSFEDDVDLSTWNERAWTLQERYLSRRMLHFCKDKFYFECRSGSCSEHNEPEVFTRFPVIFDDDATSDATLSSTEGNDNDHDDSNDEEDTNTDAQVSGALDHVQISADEDNDILEVDYSFHLFYRLIGQYSPRKLTFATDKLPALAGIANKVHMQSGSEYLAGLWEDDLAYGLLWMAPDPSDTRTTTIYRAPSWSWVNLDGQITWPSYWNVPGCPDAGRPAKSVIWISDAHIVVAGANPYGEVTSAHLILKAKSIPVCISKSTGRKHRRGYISSFPHNLTITGQTGETLVGYGQLDIAEYEISGKETYCLQVHEQIPGIGEQENSWSGLILEIARFDGNTSPVFKRIGIYLLTEDSLHVFNDVQETELKII